MHIYRIHVLGHSIRFGNDQVAGRIPPEPECWKTKIDESIWVAGGEDLACMLQVAIDEVIDEELGKERKRRRAALAGVRP